jgi:hypothetical protein
MSEHPIDFCLHLAAALRQGKKTIAYKTLPAASRARYLNAGAQPAPAYGVAGDVLWVREPFAISAAGVDFPATRATTKYDTVIAAPSIMPILPAPQMTRQQAGVLLELVDARVVRLAEDLTEASAIAAGMDPRDGRSPVEEFIAQWDAAYGEGLAVAKNPPVWRLSFVVV